MGCVSGILLLSSCPGNVKPGPLILLTIKGTYSIHFWLPRGTAPHILLSGGASLRHSCQLNSAAMQWSISVGRAELKITWVTWLVPLLHEQLCWSKRKVLQKKERPEGENTLLWLCRWEIGKTELLRYGELLLNLCFGFPFGNQDGYFRLWGFLSVETISLV